MLVFSSLFLRVGVSHRFIHEGVENHYLAKEAQK
jgi:hypothetical protein